MSTILSAWTGAWPWRSRALFMVTGCACGRLSVRGAAGSMSGVGGHQDEHVEGGFEASHNCIANPPNSVHLPETHGCKGPASCRWQTGPAERVNLDWLCACEPRRGSVVATRALVLEQLATCDQRRALGFDMLLMEAGAGHDAGCRPRVRAVTADTLGQRRQTLAQIAPSNNTTGNIPKTVGMGLSQAKRGGGSRGRGQGCRWWEQQAHICDTGPPSAVLLHSRSFRYTANFISSTRHSRAETRCCASSHRSRTVTPQASSALQLDRGE